MAYYRFGIGLLFISSPHGMDKNGRECKLQKTAYISNQRRERERLTCHGSFHKHTPIGLRTSGKSTKLPNTTP
jgi:hypothetical protein